MAWPHGHGTFVEVCNGVFRYDGLHQQKPLFKADSGAIIYFNRCLLTSPFARLQGPEKAFGVGFRGESNALPHTIGGREPSKLSGSVISRFWKMNGAYKTSSWLRLGIWWA